MLTREQVRFLENLSDLHPTITGLPHPWAKEMRESGFAEPLSVTDDPHAKLRLTDAGAQAVEEAWDANRAAWAPPPVAMPFSPRPAAESEV
jgi:hypothetical protein